MTNSTDSHDQYLQQTRQQIDMIDEKLLQLLTERSICIEQIAEIKRQKSIPLYDPNREDYVIDKMVERNPTCYHHIDIANIFYSIFRAGLNQQLLYRAKFNSPH